MKVVGKIFPSIKMGSEHGPLYTLPFGLMYVLPYGSKLSGEGDIYACHVQAAGVTEFVEWARTVPKEKIIVGGPQANLTPWMFEPYAGKVLTGQCTDLDGGFDPEKVLNRMIVPEYLQMVEDAGSYFDFVYTSTYSCPNECDFCAIRHVNKGFVNKSLYFMERELHEICNSIGHRPFIFFGDPNFLYNADWEQRMDVALRYFPRVGCQTSADSIIKNAEKLRGRKFSLIQMGLEDADSSYVKNDKINYAVRIARETGTRIKLNLIMNPDTFNSETYRKITHQLDWLDPDNIMVSYLTKPIESVEDADGYGFFNLKRWKLSNERKAELECYRETLLKKYNKPIR